jgi:hypothetical protein
MESSMLEEQCGSTVICWRSSVESNLVEEQCGE